MLDGLQLVTEEKYLIPNWNAWEAFTLLEIAIKLFSDKKIHAEELHRHCDITIRVKELRCDCSSRNVTFIPAECPSNTTDLLLMKNNLNSLGKKIFTRYTQLRYLDISSCNISAIDKSAFEKLTLLTELNLFDNPMKTFQGNIFAPLDDLQVLHISHDLLSTYPREAWSDVLNLTKVFTYGGPSNGSFAEIFSVMKNLHYFHCDYEGYVIHNYTFDSFKRTPLKYLCINGGIREIEIDTSAPLEILSSLSTLGQRFSKLSNTLQALRVFENRQMDELDLSDNFKSYGEYVISADLFAYIGNICVKRLSLRDNDIRLIDASAFQKMKYRNCLETLDLKDLNILSFLNIRNNKIAYLTTKETDVIEVLFEKSNRTMPVLLEGNPLVCTCASLDFVDWLFTTKVKLDSNGIYSCVESDGNITINVVCNQLQIMRIRCITTFVNNEWASYEATVGIEHFIGLQAKIIVISLESITKSEIPQCVMQMVLLDANDHIRKTDTLNENNIFWKTLELAMKR
ncbi:AMIGO [Mytilus edulis]|uniref:AMIGO n=1 Tax=Mytilus edulis TaxID=6550 RepID=A0A8S3QHM0_MYTED|nr:AMIGO [Mytilus edulis]